MARRVSPVLRSGIAASSAAVYGCSGAANSASAPRSSTTWPAYITATRRAISATTPMLCVTSTSAMPRSFCSPRSRSRIWAWMVTSSAVVGSSAISSFGLQAIAIAIITRWFMPPDN